MSINSGMTTTWLRPLTVVLALALPIGCASDRAIPGGADLLMPLRSQASLVGVWGGEGIRMTIKPEGAVILYNCGEARIEEAIVPDAEGLFQAEGTFTRGGGPDSVAGRPHEAALYRGTIRGGSMELTETVIGSAQPPRSFNLAVGDNGRLVLCY